jgi:vanillate O-demethylase monooxygenase subunit
MGARMKPENTFLQNYWYALLSLSKGLLRGENLVCGYVRVYPVAERHRIVWVWIGDPALADDTKIPDLE